MKTVLILAEHFPPAFSIGGKRPYRFARYLPDAGWRPVVVTKQEPEASRQDPSPHPLPDEAVLSRTLLPPWFKDRMGRPGDGTTAKPNPQRKATTSWLGRLKNQFDLPVGKKRIFQKTIVKNIARLARQYEADAIFSTSSPYEMLTLGVAAKKATGLPLVLDLRDPWSLNFFLRDKPDWYMSLVRRTEERCLSSADRVTFTCNEAAEAYRQAYPSLPEGHIRTIYNSFDPAHEPSLGTHSTSKHIELVHFGNCYGPRRLETVIRAIHKLRSQQVPDAECLRLVNLGRPAQADLDLLDNLGISEVFRWEPFVPYDQGLQRLARSSAQVLMAYGDETLYVPAKIFDYFLSGAPIVCVSASTELRNMVTETGSGLTVRPNDIVGLASVLQRIIDAHREGMTVCRPDRDSVNRFAAPETARQLAELLEEISN